MSEISGIAGGLIFPPPNNQPNQPEDNGVDSNEGTGNTGSGETGSGSGTNGTGSTGNTGDTSSNGGPSSGGSSGNGSSGNGSSGSGSSNNGSSGSGSSTSGSSSGSSSASSGATGSAASANAASAQGASRAPGSAAATPEEASLETLRARAEAPGSPLSTGPSVIERLFGINERVGLSSLIQPITRKVELSVEESSRRFIESVTTVQRDIKAVKVENQAQVTFADGSGTARGEASAEPRDPASGPSQPGRFDRTA